MRQLCHSYPHEAEWPGDNLETDLPASVLGRLLEEVSRPYTVSESREEGIGAPNVSDGYKIDVCLVCVTIVAYIRCRDATIVLPCLDRGRKYTSI